MALARALASGEVCTLQFDNELQVCGVLAEILGDVQAPAVSRFEGAWALALRGELIVASIRENEDYVLAHGPLESGLRFDDCDDATLRKRFGLSRSLSAGSDAELEFVYRSGLRIRGRLRGRIQADGGEFVALTLAKVSIWLGEDPIGPLLPEYHLAACNRLTGAFAGAPCNRYWPETSFCDLEVPRTKQHDQRDSERVHLYRDALALWQKPEADEFLPGFERLTRELAQRFPDDWLLRWNLLECLRKVDQGVVLACGLRDCLLAVERQEPGNAAIALGLRYLGFAPPSPHFGSSQNENRGES